MAEQEPQGTAASAEPGPGLEQQPAGDGASPSPPQEATAAVLSADDAAELHNPSGMESLPDEVLELILSLVPTTRPYTAAGLMRLRRVSRQWARVLYSAAVWRHHTLEVYSSHHRALLDPCIAALAFDAVSLSLDGHYGDLQAALQALATTHCKIRFLTVTIYAARDIDTVARWLPRILQQHRHQLEELSLNLPPAKTPCVHHFNFDAHPILSAIAEMPELRALSVEAPRAQRCHITFDMSHLRALRRPLRVRVDGFLVSGFSIAKLLRANKATLLEVDCVAVDDFSGSAVFDVLRLCPLLRKVSTSAMDCDTSGRLAEAGVLRTLVVTAGEPRSMWRGRDGLRSLVSLLEGSPAVPAELHLEVRDFGSQLTLLLKAVGLGGRLRSLRLADYCVPLLERHLAAALSNLPRLELLVFAKISEADWARVEAAWTERTAPALRELHVHWRDPCESRSLEWEPRMQAARPALRICTSSDCTERTTDDANAHSDRCACI